MLRFKVGAFKGRSFSIPLLRLLGEPSGLTRNREFRLGVTAREPADDTRGRRVCGATAALTGEPAFSSDTIEDMLSDWVRPCVGEFSALKTAAELRIETRDGCNAFEGRIADGPRLWFGIGRGPAMSELVH